MLETFTYNIANTKTYGHIMVNINDWNDDKILMHINLKGKLLPTFITKCVKINSAPAYRPIPFKEGDIVALSSTATRIGILKPFHLPGDTNTYANVHLSQVLGYFKDGIISIDSFIPLYDKVVMKKIDVPVSNYILTTFDSISVGEVLSTGDGGFDNKWNRLPMNVNIGDKVLIRDNITTTLSISDDEYYVTDDKYIIGKFNDDNYDINNIELYNDNISIFEEYIDDRLDGSFLFRPTLADDVEVAKSYQENFFRVLQSNELNEGIYVISRFDTEYIKFKGKTYYVAYNDKVMAKKAEGDKYGRIPNTN